MAHANVLIVCRSEPRCAGFKLSRPGMRCWCSRILSRVSQPLPRRPHVSTSCVDTVSTRSSQLCASGARVPRRSHAVRKQPSFDHMRCNDGAAGQSLLPGPGPDVGPVESSPSPCPSFDIYDLEDSQQLLHDSTPLSIEDPAFEVALATIHPDLIANSSVDGGDASSREELFSKAEEKKPKYEGELPLAGGGGGCSSGRKRAIEEPAGEEEEELTHQLKQQRRGSAGGADDPRSPARQRAQTRGARCVAAAAGAGWRL